MDFHFIRPAWLLALIPLLVILGFLRRRRGGQKIWEAVIAPHLLPSLIEGGGTKRRISPVAVLTAVMILSIFAAAGPTWTREPSPFGEDDAALVIAVEASESMLAEDLQPTRMERAAQKIHDLLSERRGARSALVVYAGSAHLVLPPTKDTDLLSELAAELNPAIMPLEGDEPSKAYALAIRQLQAIPGSVLLVTDGIAPAELERMRKLRADGGPRVHILGVAARPGSPPPLDGPPAPPLDVPALKSAARALGGAFVEITIEDQDVKALASVVQSKFSPAPGDEGERWKDAGYFLVPVIALLGMFWLRSGWSVQWNAVPFLLVLFLLPPGRSFAEGESKATNGDAPEAGERIKRWFLTADQEAQKLFDAGKFNEAAELFTDPMRKGMALYRDGQFEKAAAVFGQVPTPEGRFNRANALLFHGKYDAAISAYETVLKARPDWEAPKTNLSVAEARKQALARPDDVTAKEKLTKDDAADGFVFDLDKNNKNAATDTVAGEGGQMDEKTMRAMWLKRIQTKPADFLKNKFAYQLQMEVKDE